MHLMILSKSDVDLCARSTSAITQVRIVRDVENSAVYFVAASGFFCQICTK